MEPLLNKRGQGMSTNTIILIILGLIVLVVLIIGFTQGWDSIAPWISGSNVDSISQACGVACSTGQTFGFCTTKRDVKTEEQTYEDVTCNYLAEEMPNLGIEPCAEIQCNQMIVELQEGETLEDKCQETDYEGETIQALVDNKLQTMDCE